MLLRLNICRFLLGAFVTFGVVNNSLSQIPALTLGNIGVCKDGVVLIPLKGNGLVNIGAITLYIKYNNAQLGFESIVNIDPQISNLMYNSLSNPSRISIVWSNTKGVNFSDNVLLNLKFHQLASSGAVSFSVDSCEIADSSIPPGIISVNYVNGSFYPGSPDITEQPVDKQIPSQSDVSFNIVSDASGFNWHESTDGGLSYHQLIDGVRYSGVKTDILRVFNVPVVYNNYRYRCNLTKNSCEVFSQDALLIVDSVSGTDEIIFGGRLVSFSPIPCCTYTKLRYIIPEPGILKITLFSVNGALEKKLIEEFQSNGQYQIDLNFVSLQIGLYCIKYELETKSDVIVQYLKLLKICQ